ncbi:acyl carrier protein [Agrobacterium larrymoorei]|jgi:acyl carrier protein|uniref:Acyl carrier protein n=1 Tax=Agrobacterium larrymoorei TaxID=160699 RepID=A0AAF0HDP6_9HYPH|nr:acyl carrier protein [Agrobacterium larrymoorei]WHA43882.1 acyl carrier protein [Agrobacterium larrymoorei]
MDEIAGRIKSIIGHYLEIPADTIEDNASFTEDLGADSLEAVEIIMAIEQEFSVVINDDAAEKILSVGDAVKYLKANMLQL